MAIPVIRRESSHRAPDRSRFPHLRPVALHVVGQHVCRTCRHLLHSLRLPLLHRDCGRRNILVRVSIPNTGIDGSLTSQRQQDGPEMAVQLISGQRYIPHLHRSSEHPEITGEPVSA